MNNEINFDFKCRMVDEELRSFWPEWRVVRRLGGGSFGDVFHITRTNMGMRNDSAMKVIQILDEVEPTTLLAHMEEETLTNGFMPAGSTPADDMQQTSPLPKSVYNEIRIMEILRGAPNIVAIEDFYYKRDPNGSNAARLYIRMELLKSFQELLSGNNAPNILSIPEICKLATDICTALNYCEKNNIIHRDIKPANMFVDRFGNYKIGDFGASRNVASLQMAQTMTGIGTISYMAPEIYNRAAYNHTVDIYALGLVLYQLLNYGRAPFLPEYPTEYTTADIDTANYQRLHGRAVPVIHSIDHELDTIVRKACAYKSEDRYQTAAEMKLAVERYVQRRSVGVPDTGKTHKAKEYQEAAANTGKSGQKKLQYQDEVNTSKNVRVYKDETADIHKKKSNGAVRTLSEKRLAVIGVAAVCLFAAVLCILLKSMRPDGQGDSDWEKSTLAFASSTNVLSDDQELPIGSANVNEAGEEKTGQGESVITGTGDQIESKEDPEKDLKELENNYQRAEDALLNKEYLKAAIEFGKAAGYKDARERSLELWKKYGNCSTVDIGTDSICALAEDGTVYSSNFFNYSEDEYAEIKSWTDIVSVRWMQSNSAALDTLIGLRADGTIVSSDRAHYSGLSEDKPELELTDIVEIEPIINGGFAALGSDGTVYSVPRDYRYIVEENVLDEADIWKIVDSEWHDLEHIAGGYGGILGIRSDGVLLFHPTEEDSEIPEFHRGYGEDRRFTEYQGMKFKEIGIDTIGGSWMYVLLDTDGQVHVIQTPSEDGIAILSEEEIQEVESFHDVSDIDIGTCTVILVHENGAVTITQADSFRENYELDNALSWEGISKISYDDDSGIVGIKKDGSFLYAGDGIGTPSQISEWDNIEKVIKQGSIIALKKNGTAIASEESFNSFLKGKKHLKDVTPEGLGLKEDGTLCDLWFSNQYIWEQGEEPDEFLKEISQWKDIIQIENSRWAGSPCAVLHSDGTITVSRNYAHTDRMDHAEELYACEEWESIKSILFDTRMAVGLKKDGTVCYSYYGDGDSSDLQVTEKWTNIEKIVGDDDELAALTSQGRILCTDPSLQSEIENFEKHHTDLKAIDLQYKDYKGYLYCKYEDGWHEFGTENEDISANICADRNVKQLVDADAGMLLLYEDGHVVVDSTQVNSTEAMKTWKNLRVQ